MNEENNCPICFSICNVENTVRCQNTVIFKNCTHMFCRQCATNIIFTRKVSCPMCREKVWLVYDSYLIENNHLPNNKRTVKEYQRDLIMYFPVIIEYMMRQNCAIILPLLFKGLEKAESKITKCIEYLKKWLARQKIIVKEEINEVEEILNAYEFNDEESYNAESFDILCVYLDELVGQISNNFFFQVQKFNIIRLRIESLDEFPLNLQYFNIPNSSQDALLKNTINRYQSDIEYINKFKLCIISNVISLGIVDGSLFKELQSNINESETNKCLICVESIDCRNYFKFSDCNHKLCLNCVKEFFISTGDCPFCGNESNNDITGNRIPTIFINENTETALKYLKKEIQLMTKELSNDFIITTIWNIDRLISFSFPLEPFRMISDKLTKEILTFIAEYRIPIPVSFCLKSSDISFANENQFSRYRRKYNKFKCHCFAKFLSFKLIDDVGYNLSILFFMMQNIETFIRVLNFFEIVFWNKFANLSTENININFWRLINIFKGFRNLVEGFIFHSVDNVNCDPDLLECYKLSMRKLQEYLNQDEIQHIVKNVNAFCSILEDHQITEEDDSNEEDSTESDEEDSTQSDEEDSNENESDNNAGSDNECICGEEKE